MLLREKSNVPTRLVRPTSPPHSPSLASLPSQLCLLLSASGPLHILFPSPSPRFTGHALIVLTRKLKYHLLWSTIPQCPTIYLHATVINYLPDYFVSISLA